MQNQQPSWIDNPFNMKGPVTGVTHVNHQRNLTAYAEELVSHYAKFEDNQFEISLDMVPDSSVNELIRLYIESTDREVNECVYGNDFSIENDFTCALLAMLKNDCSETRNAFSDVTRNNTITYYRESLQEVLNDACNHHYYMLSQENHQDYENDGCDDLYLREA